ncbi:MAG: pyridoxamine 5'-phosphate oxidase [Chlamydiales bacterium]
MKLIYLFAYLFWALPLSAISYSDGAIKKPLSLQEMPDNPMTAFQAWFQEAFRLEGKQNASTMTLSTATAGGRPSSRMMLLKGVNDQGLIFYGDLRSTKFQQLRINPYASIAFYWPALRRQVIVSGKVVPVPAEIAGEYFSTRKRDSQAASHVCNQGSPLNSREELLAAHQEVMDKYENQEIPAPTHWGGYQLIPDRAEFWQGDPKNLHSRVEYTKSNGNWKKQFLHP